MSKKTCNGRPTNHGRYPASPKVSSASNTTKQASPFCATVRPRAVDIWEKLEVPRSAFISEESHMMRSVCPKRGSEKDLRMASLVEKPGRGASLPDVASTKSRRP